VAHRSRHGDKGFVGQRLQVLRVEVVARQGNGRRLDQGYDLALDHRGALSHLRGPQVVKKLLLRGVVQELLQGTVF
jgi:hypothetical protein